MGQSTPVLGTLKLSICITTFNRAAYLVETLHTILSQATEGCEVVVLDAGSTDHTARAVAECEARYGRVRYFRQSENLGFDRDCDRVVQHANGDYCWLMADDDLVVPGAVEKIMRSLQHDFSLIVVNSDIRDFSMSKILQRRRLAFEADRMYATGEMDRLLAELGRSLTYVGRVVIKREIWLSRNREKYYGTMFIHLGVIFQSPLPGPTFLISEPLISYRMGNGHTYTPEVFEIFMVKWPSLVWSFPLTEEAKGQVCRAIPWKSMSDLLAYRGRGYFSLVEYRRWIRPNTSSVWALIGPILIANIPTFVANALLTAYFSVTNRSFRGVNAEVWLDDLRKYRSSLVRA